VRGIGNGKEKIGKRKEKRGKRKEGKSGLLDRKGTVK